MFCVGENERNGGNKKWKYVLHLVHPLGDSLKYETLAVTVKMIREGEYKVEMFSRAGKRELLWEAGTVLPLESTKGVLFQTDEP